MKKITALFLSFLIAIAPVYQAHAFIPAVGAVVTSVVGAAVVDAGLNAVVNVVAGKSPWGASDNVFGGKVKIPIKSIGDWVKKQGKSVGFWTAAMLLAGYFMDSDNNVRGLPDSFCSVTNSVTTFYACRAAVIAEFQADPTLGKNPITDVVLIDRPSDKRIIFHIKSNSMGWNRGYFGVSMSAASTVSDSDWNKFLGDNLSKIGYGDNPFTLPGQQYPTYPVDGQMWPTTVTPITPPMRPDKPWPTPVPTPQPIPTPDNPAFPVTPDEAWKPFPLPDHTVVKPVDPPPVTNPGTEVKPTPDGGFVIPNPLPVVVDGPVDVNLLNIEQPLTAAQLAQRDLRIDNDSAAALGSPDVLSNDSYFDAFKPVNDMMNNLPSPPSFNFTAGMFGIPSYSSCIPYTFTIPSMGFGSMSIPSQNVTIGQHCAYYDANLRPFVAWLFQALALLTVYRIAVRSTRI